MELVNRLFGWLVVRKKCDSLKTPRLKELAVSPFSTEKKGTIVLFWITWVKLLFF
jgi:hypothetical protein